MNRRSARNVSHLYRLRSRTNKMPFRRDSLVPSVRLRSLSEPLISQEIRQKSTRDTLYLSIDYGLPSLRNAWRKRWPTTGTSRRASRRSELRQIILTSEKLYRNSWPRSRHTPIYLWLLARTSKSMISLGNLMLLNRNGFVSYRLQMKTVEQSANLKLTMNWYKKLMKIKWDSSCRRRMIKKPVSQSMPTSRKSRSSYNKNLRVCRTVRRTSTLSTIRWVAGPKESLPRCKNNCTEWPFRRRIVALERFSEISPN